MSAADGPPANAPAWRGDDVPGEGRLLGIDYGEKRLGFALSTPEQNLSTPLETWTRRGESVDARRLREIGEEYCVKGIVVGLPLHSWGDEGTSAHRAREFGKWVKETLRLPVTFWDERCSSAAADDWMMAANLSRDQRRARRDMLAAHVILQSFLDRRRALLSGDDAPGSDEHDESAEEE